MNPNCSQVVCCKKKNKEYKISKYTLLHYLQTYFIALYYHCYLLFNIYTVKNKKMQLKKYILSKYSLLLNLFIRMCFQFQPKPILRHQ